MEAQIKEGKKRAYCEKSIFNSAKKPGSIFKKRLWEFTEVELNLFSVAERERKSQFILCYHSYYSLLL